MKREEIDTLWHKALQQAIKDGEEFTRYHFAALVAAAERDRMCEQFNIPKELAHEKAKSNEAD